MRRLVFCLFFCLATVFCAAQTRSYADNASKTYIVGLDSYFYGASGSIDFRAGGRDAVASVKDGAVLVDGAPLVRVGDGWETIIGVHDFTGNREAELVVALRSERGVVISVHTLAGGRWKEAGKIAFPREDARDIRVFRQVISVRRGDVLCSWTWHGDRFDFKASDGSAEPTFP